MPGHSDESDGRVVTVSFLTLQEVEAGAVRISVMLLTDPRSDEGHGDILVNDGLQVAFPERIEFGGRDQIVPLLGKMTAQGCHVGCEGHLRLQEHFLDLIHIVFYRLKAACEPELKREIDVHPGTEYPEQGNGGNHRNGSLRIERARQREIHFRIEPLVFVGDGFLVVESEAVSVDIGKAVRSHVVCIFDVRGEFDLAADAYSGPDLDLGRQDDTRSNGNSRNEIESDQMDGFAPIVGTGQGVGGREIHFRVE